MDLPTDRKKAALVGLSSSPIGAIGQRVADLLRDCWNAYALGGSTHPDEHAELLRRYSDGRPLIATVYSPYMAAHFEDSEIWAVAVKDGEVYAARQSTHPDRAEWIGKLDPGEFWASVGEQWVLEHPEAVGVEAIAAKIAEVIRPGSCIRAHLKPAHVAQRQWRAGMAALYKGQRQRVVESIPKVAREGYELMMICPETGRPWIRFDLVEPDLTDLATRLLLAVEVPRG